MRKISHREYQALSPEQQQAYINSHTRKPKKPDIDTRIEKAYYRTCSGVQINIMDIPRIFRAVRNSMIGHTNMPDEELDVLVKSTVDSVRVN